MLPPEYPTRLLTALIYLFNNVLITSPVSERSRGAGSAAVGARHARVSGSEIHKDYRADDLRMLY